MDENTPAGGEQPKGNEDFIKNLKLTEEQLETLKSNDTVYKLFTEVTSNVVKQKRDANSEAKTYREELEALKIKFAEDERKRLEKRGKFEELANQYKTEKESLEKKVERLAIEKEISLLAAQKGIKKPAYLKLLDTSLLKLDENMNVIGAEEVFNEFYEQNKELFTSEKLGVSEPKPGIKADPAGSDLDKEIEMLAKKARSTASPRDIANWERAVRKKEEMNK